MEALKEVTVWNVPFRQPNHIYLMKGDKIHAYIKWGEGEPEYLKHPLRMDKRGRKFVAADKNLFKTAEDTEKIVKIQGSKGQTYYVNTLDKTCSCPGYTYRGACKHLVEIG